MLLRKYLYIDEEFIDDSFATINGFDYNRKDISQEDIAFSQTGSAPEVKNEAQERTSTQITANMTSSAKLQFVIDYLNNEMGGAIPYYESMDRNKLLSLKREDFFEGCFRFSFTKIETYGNFAESIQKLDQLIGSLKTDETESVEQLKRLAKQEREKGLPCILTFANETTPTVYAYLNEKNIRGDRYHLVGEVSILCKVIRTMKSGECVCLTDFSELMNMKFPDTVAGRKAKMAAIKNGQMKQIKEFEDKIMGPAIEVLPVAIYR